MIYDGHGNDMHNWFQKVGYILSTSDFEGSHQAVAEGMAAGSVPIIYNWDGADTVYPEKFVYKEGLCDFKHFTNSTLSPLGIKNYAIDNFSSFINVRHIRDLCELG